MDVDVFVPLFRNYALVAMGVSLACVLAWYALGEWGLKPHSPSGTWYLTWFALLVVILATDTVLSIMGPKGATLDPINYNVAAFYFGSSLLFFYLSSVLFSPANARFLIWPAIIIRK